MSWFTRHIHLGNLATGIVIGSVMGAFIALNPDTPTMFDVSPSEPVLTPADQIVQQAYIDADARLALAKANARAAVIAALEEEEEKALWQANNMQISQFKRDEEVRRTNHQQIFDACDRIVEYDAPILPPCTRVVYQEQ